MSKKDGGPAFPVHVTDGGADLDGELWFPGLSMRDYFAAKAMAVIIAQNPIVGNAELIAKAAYMAADGMLTQRAKP